jgi:hypothetical protein
MAVATSERRASARRAAAHFVQAAFSVLQAHVAAGHEVPFALEEARRDGRPALYDYRPLFRSYVTQRVDELTPLADFRVATDALAADPALLAVARDQVGATDEATALRDAVLVPLVVGVAEGCGGFDFDEGVFDALYARLEGAVAGARRAYAAFTPLVGVRGAPDAVDLGGGVVLRRSDASTLAERWPECQALLPDRFGVDPDRQHGLELDLALDRASDQAPPDAVAAFVRAVVALRLVTGGAVTAGPIVFERVDWSPRAVARCLRSPRPRRPASLRVSTRTPSRSSARSSPDSVRSVASAARPSPSRSPATAAPPRRPTQANGWRA